MLLSETQSERVSNLSIQKPLNLLVLCTGNSARSVMAEALFNRTTNGLFVAFSAGSHPSGKVNPFALEQIAPLNIKYPLRSKSWEEFAHHSSVRMDIVLTVCGNAAQEMCPNFMGAAQHVHWGLPDPAAVTGNDDNIRRAFYACYSVFAWRINKLMDLYETTSNASLIELMRDLANQYPLLPEINEHGFTSVVQ